MRETKSQRKERTDQIIKLQAAGDSFKVKTDSLIDKVANGQLGR